MTEQWQRVERPDEDLILDDERSRLEDQFARVFREKFESHLRARGQLRYLESSARGFAQAQVRAMEKLLADDGWADYCRGHGFESAWAGFVGERGQPTVRIEFGAPEAGAYLSSWRADQAGPVSGGLLTMSQHEHLVQVAVTAAVNAVKSQPEVTSVEIAQLDEAGKVTKRSQVVTRRRPVDVTTP